MLGRYLKLSEMSIKSMLAYRMNFFGGLGQSILSLVAMWFIWNAIFSSAGTAEIQGLTLSSMITYLFVSTLMRSYSYSYVEWDMQEDARTGRITRHLTLPTAYPLFRFFVSSGEASYNFLTRAVPLMIGAFFFLNITLPASPLFFVSAVLSYLISFSISFLTGLWVFWSGGSIWGLRFSVKTINDMISGAFIPLFLFPDFFVKIFQLLPFAAAFHIPLSIYIGKISGAEIFSALGEQLFWALALSALAWLIWLRAEKKIYSQGG